MKPDPHLTNLDSHATLRANTIDRYIKKLEDTVSLKGISVGNGRNKIQEALQDGNGVLTNDEHVFVLSRLYLSHPRYLPKLPRATLVEISVTDYFSFEEAADSIHIALFQRSLRHSKRPAIALFDALALKRRASGNQKPLFHLLLHWEANKISKKQELQEFLDFSRSILVTREAKLLLFSKKLSAVPEEIAKELTTFNPSGYFS